MLSKAHANNVRLGGGTDTGHRETDVDGGADTTEEEFCLQEDLTIGNGNDLSKVFPIRHVLYGRRWKMWYER